MIALEQARVKQALAILARLGWKLGGNLASSEDVCRCIDAIGYGWIPLRRTSDDARAQLLLIAGNGEDVVSDGRAPRSVFDAFYADLMTCIDEIERSRPDDV